MNSIQLQVHTPSQAIFSAYMWLSQPFLNNWSFKGLVIACMTVAKNKSTYAEISLDFIILCMLLMSQSGNFINILWQRGNFINILWQRGNFINILWDHCCFQNVFSIVGHLHHWFFLMLLPKTSRRGLFFRFIFKFYFTKKSNST